MFNVPHFDCSSEKFTKKDYQAIVFHTLFFNVHRYNVFSIICDKCFTYHHSMYFLDGSIRNKVCNSCIIMFIIYNSVKQSRCVQHQQEVLLSKSLCYIECCSFKPSSLLHVALLFSEFCILHI